MSNNDNTPGTMLYKQGTPYKNLTMYIPKKTEGAQHQPSPLFSMHPTRHIPLVNSPNNQSPAKFMRSPTTPSVATYERIVGTPPIPKKSKFITNNKKQALISVENIRKSFNLFTITMIMLVTVEVVDLIHQKELTYMSVAKAVVALIMLAYCIVSQVLRSAVLMGGFAVLNGALLLSTFIAVMVTVGPASMLNGFGVLPVSFILVLLALCYSVVYSARYYAEKKQEVNHECYEIVSSDKVDGPYVMVSNA
jgi:hypothetical protein